MKHYLFVISILSMTIISFGIKLNIELEWKYVDFLWDNLEEKQKRSIPHNLITAFVNKILVDGRIFVTAARIKGVPASVMTVTNKTGTGGPLLRPYPDWSWYTKNDCNGITTGVYRINIKCNHLFIMDGGKVEPNGIQICPPKLLIFDLSTDKLVLMGDADGYGLGVYNANTSKVCRIETPFMRPIDTLITVANQSYHISDGIEPMAIVRNDFYYAATAGRTIYKMEMSKLSECALTNSEATKQTQVVATLSGQTGPMASEKCVLFFSNIPKTSIMCADTSRKIKSDNMEVIVQDSEKLQTPYGLKYVPYKLEGELLILSNRYQRAATNTRNLNETNFRVLSMNAAEIRKETNCFASCNY
nr:PREDICTED: major royal jelly protein 1-like [Linepithema humile]